MTPWVLKVPLSQRGGTKSLTPCCWWQIVMPMKTDTFQKHGGHVCLTVRSWEREFLDNDQARGNELDADAYQQTLLATWLENNLTNRARMLSFDRIEQIK